MKKLFLLVPVAALVMTACTSESTESVGATAQQPKEISFAPIAQPATRAIVSGVGFPEDLDIFVSAYSTDASDDYFDNVTFSKDVSNAYWTGNEYWPLSPTTLNFLGIANIPKANITSFTSAAATVKWTHNGTLTNSDDMYDLLYGTGTGSVAYGEGANVNKLTYGNNVDMPFSHAAAQVAFRVALADAGYASKIRITKIVLNDMVTEAEYAITNTNTTTNVASGVWTAKDLDSDSEYTADTDVPGSNAFASSNMTASLQNNGAVVVPCKNTATTFDSFSGFDVYFTMNDNPYVYHYTPSAAEKVLEQGKKYIFDLTFTLTEIRIAPRVVDWVVNDFDGETEDTQNKEINIPEQ